jgi:uncharacterized protein YceK
MKWILLLLAVIGVVIISGCTQQASQDVSEQAKTECIALCKASAADLSNGPCLSDNNPGWKTSDWACDVAHSPRQAIDNQPENQCAAFREGKAHHFVEVDPGCGFIKAV